ncbi:MAG TPA: XRE family transcriptional regulator [Gemmatimonadaceae bacterium]|nr:XRE family transcriptional regulator [Gemmatimonadaceae bacterium]
MGTSPGLSAVIARNIKRIRTEWGWSFDTLSERAGVSRGMLLKIEQGSVNPSVGTLVRIADALGTNVARLVEEGQPPRVQVVAPGDHQILWRGKRGSTGTLLGGADRGSHLESWAWTIAPNDGYTSAAHPAGTQEFIYVTKGTLTLVVSGEPRKVPSGGSVTFDAAHDHSYLNEDRKQALSLVMFIATPDQRRMK